MNVELCISRVGSIKYLFKYVFKGSDRVTVEIGGVPIDEHNVTNSKVVPAIDEIRYYQDARHISASEAAWRLFSFPILEHEPSVERLEVHLEGHHTVYYKEGEHESAKKSEKKSLRSLLHTFLLISRTKTRIIFSTLILPSTSLGTKQKDYGSQERNTKSAVSHLRTTISQPLVQVWSAGCTISTHEKGSTIFSEHCFYTNLGLLPSRIFACMKVFNIQLTVIRAVPCVFFRMMQDG